jgi:dCTP deaminase
VSILADKNIRARSLVPTHTYLTSNYQRLYYTLADGKLYDATHGTLFSDAPQDVAGWIDHHMKRLTDDEIKGWCAKYPRMITPFEPQLVRNKASGLAKFHELYPEFTAEDWERFDTWDRNGFQPELSPGEKVLDNEGLFRAYKRALAEMKNTKVISYGTSSYGYDVRCADEFKIFTNVNSTIVDPKNFDEKSFVAFKGEVCVIPPNSFALARTVERFKIPRDVLTVCVGKSTYARCGIIVNVTPFEPEWEGYVTLEFSNTTPLPAKIYANEGVAQVLFFKADSICETSYKDRGGKYQGQGAEVVCPKV